jgi:hypothetical protein
MRYVWSKTENKLSDRHTCSDLLDDLLVLALKNQVLTDSLQAMPKTVHARYVFRFPTHMLCLSFRLKSVQENHAAKQNMCGGLYILIFGMISDCDHKIYIPTVRSHFTLVTDI